LRYVFESILQADYIDRTYSSLSMGEKLEKLKEKEVFKGEKLSRFSSSFL
jgi:hypothetical protein